MRNMGQAAKRCNPSMVPGPRRDIPERQQRAVQGPGRQRLWVWQRWRRWRQNIWQRSVMRILDIVQCRTVIHGIPLRSSRSVCKTDAASKMHWELLRIWLVKKRSSLGWGSWRRSPLTGVGLTLLVSLLKPLDSDDTIILADRPDVSRVAVTVLHV